VFCVSVKVKLTVLLLCVCVQVCLKKPYPKWPVPHSLTHIIDLYLVIFFHCLLCYDIFFTCCTFGSVQLLLFSTNAWKHLLHELNNSENNRHFYMRQLC